MEFLRLRIVLPDGLRVNTSFKRSARICMVKHVIRKLVRDPKMVFWLVAGGNQLLNSNDRVGDCLHDDSVVFVLVIRSRVHLPVIRV